jgi:hypothetical protein
MPVGYKIDKEHRLVMSTAYGVVTREDVLFHQQRLVTDPDFRPTYSQLADFTHMAVLEFDATAAGLFAAGDVFAPEARRAFIVSNKEAFGLARVFDTLRGSNGEEGIRVFLTVEEGFDWISPRGTSSL